MGHRRYTRRGVLRTAVAVGTITVGGCVFGVTGPEPGDLVIDNRRGERQSITVDVTRMSEDTNDVRKADQTPAPESTPLSATKATFTVDGGSELVEHGFVTEPGAYYVEAESGEGQRDANWIRISEAIDGGLSSGFIRIDVLEDGRIDVEQRVKV